jgi:GrpB-like predicted nucleotidyltransferase (UPF0157 family)
MKNNQIIPKNILKTNFKYRLMKYILCLKDILYSYSYSNKTKIIISPYDRMSGQVAKKIITKIHELNFKLPVHFVGSSALKIAGIRDIDILIECPKEKLSLIYPMITKIWNNPVKNKGEYIEWIFSLDGFEVDILLIDPKSIIFLRDINIFQSLKNNPVYLRKYEKLKISLNGKSLREYDIAKCKFLKSVPGYWNF